jgi:hypothetical protein
MFGIKSDSGDSATGRILDPRAALIRLRPVKLGDIRTAIWSNAYRVGVLKLVRKFFPPMLWDVLPVGEWTDILRYFLYAVENERGIKMDWVAMDDLYSWAEEDSPEDDDDEEAWEPMGLEMLALAIKVIPVECFGFDDGGLVGLQMNEYPALLLLNSLLDSDGYDLPNDYLFLRGMGEWGKGRKQAARQRLEGLDTAGLAEPLCWLPEMGRYVCSETGNDFLDYSSGFEKWEMATYSRGKSWNDLDEVCRLWNEAKRTHERAMLFNDWACDGQNRLEQITTLVSGRQL